MSGQLCGGSCTATINLLRACLVEKRDVLRMLVSFLSACLGGDGYPHGVFNGVYVRDRWLME